MTVATPLDHNVLLQRPLPSPSNANDKNSRGRVLAVAGSVMVPGAALLTGIASLRAGAGKTQLAIPRSIAVAIGTAFPESGLLPLDETEDGNPVPTPKRQLIESVRKADAILVGPGLMDVSAAMAMAQEALGARVDGAFVLDALALCDARIYGAHIRQHGAKVVLTPHHGEMAQMLGVDKSAIAQEPLSFARKAAAEFECCVILKSDITHVVCPSGAAWEHKDGAIGLATAGSGDVLAGILAGLLARGADPVTASLWAVLIHAGAGQILTRNVGVVGFLARELLDLIPKVMTDLSSVR
jgi:ADP-dependent NAD(P)H-hydrate dehydratase